MWMRLLLTIGLFATVGLLAAAAPLTRADRTHNGVVVSAGGGKLIMSDSEGNNELAYDIPDRVTVMLDGVPAKLVELMKGDTVAVTVGNEGEVVTVRAKRDRK